MTALSVGLDLGSVNDFSALAVVERVQVLPPGMGFGHYERRHLGPSEPTLTEELRVVHLQRWETGTPYPTVVDDVCALMRTPQLDESLLWVDSTGVGVAVWQLFNDAWTAGRMGRYNAQGVTITGGDKSQGRSVTKRDLLSALLVPVQQGRLKVAAGLPLGTALERELLAFRLKLTAAGRDTYDVQRKEGEGHGDLTIALALAARRANMAGTPELVLHPDTLTQEIR